MNRRSIMRKFADLIAVAFILSVCLFFLSYSISNYIIDRMSDAKTDEKIVSELEAYANENRLKPENRKELWEWCRTREVDIEVFVDGHLVFSSIFDVEDKQYNMEETERDKENARQVQFGDVKADVVFYPYYHVYDKAMAVEIAASVLLCFIIIVIAVRKESRYIHLINEELQVLEGGDLTKEITVRGDDEITMLAESVNEFRKSMLTQIVMIEQLERSNRLTLAEIAHDLRTPLTSLIMYLDFAQKEIEGRETAAELYLTRAREKSARLKNLLDQNYSYTTMQDYSQMEKTEEPGDSGYEREIRYVLSRVGMSGEKGADDIVKICVYLRNSGKRAGNVSIGRLCEILSDAPKNMEQRIRRAIAAGMSNLAHLGVEDYMNETFTEYSNTLFPFEEVRCEMDYIRGKRRYGGKVTIKKFIDALMLEAENHREI